MAHIVNRKNKFLLAVLPLSFLSFVLVAMALLISPAQAGSPSTNLNFQARLLNSAGNVVPDGNYNIEFNLYDVVSGGTTLWTEARLNNNSQGVRVVNGYMSVNLGSVTSFPSTIEWNEENWITMNIGNTNPTCTPFSNCSPDGEMTPRIKLTALPYAFSAGELAKTSGANRGTLSFNSVTNNPVITLPNETGTVCTTGSVCTGYQAAGSYFVNGGNSFSGTATLGTNDSNSLALETGGNTQATIAVGGATLFKNSTDSATAFQIQDSNSTALFVADTTRADGTADAITINVTPDDTAGTLNGLVINQLSSANTNGLDNGLVIDNEDADLAITNGLSFTNSGGGGYTQEISLMNGLTIANTDNNDLNLTENSVSLNIDFAETTGSTITFSTASKLELESTNNAADGLKLESTTGGIDIFASNASAGEDIDITATGSSVNITSTEADSQAIYLNASGGGLRSTSTSSVFFTAGAGFTIDANAGSRLEVTGSGQDLDIEVSGGGAQELRLTSAGTGTGAITLNANGSGGDIDINANDAITIDSASVNLTLAAGTTDFTIAGLDSDSNVILSGMGTDANAVLYTTTGGVLTRVVETETGSQCLLSGAGSSGVPTWGSCPGGGGNTFLNMDTEDGTDPAADTSTDTLILTSTGSNITITGDSSADSVTFDLVEGTLAGAGLVANGDAIDIVSGNAAIVVNAGDITFDQNFSFAWTADHTWTLAGAENLDVSYSSPPTDDFLKLSNSGQATTTDNVDGLEITLAQGAGSAINNAGLRIVASTTDGDSTLNGINIDLTNSSSGGTQRGLIVVNNDVPANAVTEAMIALRNEEATASTVTDGLVISGTAGSGTDTITDAIDVSDDNILNGLNLGTNFLVASSDSINDFTGNAGLVISSNALTLDASVTGDGLSATTSSGSGLEVIAGQGLTLLAGCDNTEILKWNEGSDVWECETDQTGGGSPTLDTILAATGAGTAQDSNANSIFWNWDFQGAGVDSGLTISESSNSTSGSQDQQALLELITLASSTASPLQVTAGGTDVGDIFFDLTGTSDFQVRDGGTSVFTVNDDGTIVAQNATNSTAAFTIATSSGTALFASDTANLINRPGLAPSYTTTAQTDTEISDSDSVGQFTSTTIGVDGLPIISYYEGDTGGGGCSTNECNLKVTHCGNASCSSGNTTTEFEDADDVGSHNSIAIGTDGLPIISHYNATGTGGNLQISKCANINCTALSSDTEISDADAVGTFSSIAIGADGLPVISHRNSTGDNLQISKCANVNCTSLSNDTEISDADNVGQYSSITIGTDGLPIISSFNDTNDNLQVSHCSNATCTSMSSDTEFSDADSVGFGGTAIAIGVDGLPIIASYNASNGNTQMSHCANASCTSLSSDTEITDADNVGNRPSIAIGTDGLAIVSTDNQTGQNLQISHCANVACTSFSQDTEISDADDTGNYSSIAIGTDGIPIISSYNDSANFNLQILKCANRLCTSTATTALTGGIDLGTVALGFRSVYFNTLNMGDEDAGLTFDDQGTLKVKGNIIAGQGIEYIASDTNPSCSSGEYKIYADLSEAKIKKCQNGTASDLTFSGRTLSTEFGDYYSGGAFESKNSYFGEEFNIGKANNQTCTGSTTATEWGWARGDMGAHTAASGTCGTSSNRDSGELNFSIKLGNTAGTCTAASQLDTVNGIERITATSTTAASNSANCVETLAATQSTSNKIYLTNNRPVVTMKVKPSTLQDSGSGGNGVVHIGMSAGNTATGVGLNSLDNGVYFTNCSTWNDGAVPSGCSNTTWYGVTSDGDSSNVLTCSTGSGSLTSQFSYLRIEVISSSEIHFYADYDVSNGISESECGAGATTTANMPAGSTAIAPWMQSVFKSNTANSTVLDLDYFRSWQDDSVPLPEESVETTPSGEDIVAEAPIEPDTDTTSSIADSDPSLNKDFFSFLASTSEDQIFYHDVYVKGTLFANKIKANQIEGLELYVDKIANLKDRLAVVSGVSTGRSEEDDTSHVSSTGSGSGGGSDGLEIVALSLNLSNGLVVNGTSEFHGNALFYKLVTFVEKTIFKNDVTFEGHFITSGSKPTAIIDNSAGSASGDIPNPSVEIEGNDISGQVALRLGSSTVEGDLVTIKFNKAFAKAPHIIITPANAEAAELKYYVTSTPEGFVLVAGEAAQQDSTIIFNYWTVE